jgi:hypothetical protein
MDMGNRCGSSFRCVGLASTKVQRVKEGWCIFSVKNRHEYCDESIDAVALRRLAFGSWVSSHFVRCMRCARRICSAKYVGTVLNLSMHSSVKVKRDDNSVSKSSLFHLLFSDVVIHIKAI